MLAVQATGKVLNIILVHWDNLLGLEKEAERDQSDTTKHKKEGEYDFRRGVLT